MGKISAIFSVLQAGSEVVDKARGKSGQLTANYVVVFISAVIGLLNLFDCSWCDFQLTSDQMIGISTAIITIYGLFNNLATAATSQHATINPVENVKILLKTKDLPPVSDELAKQIQDAHK